MVYIGFAIPSVLFFILAMITSGMIIKGKIEFKICETVAALSGESEKLYSYLLGKFFFRTIIGVF